MARMDTDVGGYCIPAIPTLPTQGCSSLCCTKQLLLLPRNARNAQNLLAEKGLPRMSTDVHRLGGYGIPAIPTLPNSVYSVNSVGEQCTITICVHPCHPWEKRYSHGTHGTFWQRRASHRWHGWTQIRRVWHPCHTNADKFCGFCEFRGNKAHPKHLCKSVKSVGEKIFPQNARNTRNLLAEKSLPQMSTDVHRLGGYGIPAIPTLPNSVYSVNSVGEQRTITICVHPCHPWEKRYSRRTHGTHGTFWQRKDSHRWAQMFTD